jgi:uncharacterized YigZ family protein
MQPSYSTIARRAEAEIEVKKSRFLCVVARVEGDFSARGVIIEARKRHPDARHHCSAFVLGPDAAIQRTNDDGEPSGTAGAPMLEVINGRGISDVVAVVTRYFGGTLLGTGGLVRAYADAVAAALDEAGVQHRQLQQLLEVTVPIADAGRLDNQLRNIVTVRDVEYGSDAVLTVAVPMTEAEAFGDNVAQLSAGTAQLREVGEEWIDVSARAYLRSREALG